MKHYNYLKIKCVPGKQAPKYSEGMELAVDQVTITEQGTESGLPIVDFVCSGPDGQKYLIVLSGRMVNTLSAAVKGTNLRNHGIEEP